MASRWTVSHRDNLIAICESFRVGQAGELYTIAEEQTGYGIVEHTQTVFAPGQWSRIDLDEDPCQTESREAVKEPNR